MSKPKYQFTNKFNLPINDVDIKKIIVCVSDDAFPDSILIIKKGDFIGKTNPDKTFDELFTKALMRGESLANKLSNVKEAEAFINLLPLDRTFLASNENLSKSIILNHSPLVPFYNKFLLNLQKPNEFLCTVERKAFAEALVLLMQTSYNFQRETSSN